MNTFYYLPTLSASMVWMMILGGMAIALIFLLIPYLRRNLITRWIFLGIQKLKLLPQISDTEKEAIEAGNAWVEKEFFTGKPDWKYILKEPYPHVNPEIQDFLDNQVEKVCEMATDWAIYQHKNLPLELWKYLKHEKFFGMMIPKEYGGLGFSNLAYSAVMMKLASRSFTHVATVGVTNSLGPAKLLMHYGTPEQKSQYLPRLAIGEEIPCFALTEPNAGSDAASLLSKGEVFRGEDGKLYLKLNWKKRYITLGAIATLLGLAVRVYDPDHLLGKGEDVGITCVLVPTNTEGVIINQRHDPMGVPFYNSPTEGHDVILPVEQIIGGVKNAGKGWQMLMQSLAAGRGVSFPASCTGVAKLVTRVASAHSVNRKQFGLSIGRFEGIEEPLARIAGFTYMLDALRLFTCGAVDNDKQPAVSAAIAKYISTELARKVVIDGMDILGGSGICRGERNLLANVYTAMPIAITVEGANILTRTLMIFGQGAIRCHPYIYDEIQALNNQDLVGFDRTLSSHISSFAVNKVRALMLTISSGTLTLSPVSGATAQYYQKLTFASTTFALLSDFLLVAYGGKLKRKEKLTGRFADALTWMYLATCTLRRYEAEGQPKAELPLVHWSLQYALYQIQMAFEGILNNVDLPIFSSLLRSTSLPWVRWNKLSDLPSDRLGHEVADLLQNNRFIRERLTEGIYIPNAENEALGRLEKAFNLVHASQPVLNKIKQAIATGLLPQDKPEKLLDLAQMRDVITQAEFDLVCDAEFARNDAIQVDAFDLEEYQNTKDDASTLIM
ncbi:MAG: acyl-CoA dehydrogenase [Limnothrix sp. RL_2_0]|nr:acyl-CoA dehydrogenase [Limnothrix sp. RL_2_0]